MSKGRDILFHYLIYIYIYILKYKFLVGMFFKNKYKKVQKIFYNLAFFSFYSSLFWDIYIVFFFYLSIQRNFTILYSCAGKVKKYKSATSAHVERNDEGKTVQRLRFKGRFWRTYSLIGLNVFLRREYGPWIVLHLSYAWWAGPIKPSKKLFFFSILYLFF